MKAHGLLVIGFAVGMLLPSTQACVTQFECIYIYAKQPKLCAELFEVATVGGGGTIADANGAPPMGCTCLTPELSAIFGEDAQSAELDDLYAAIEADARANCVVLANEAGQDPSPCQSAQLAEGSAITTPDKFDECKVLVGTIDEDNDGNCPDPDPEDAGETGETGETGGFGLPDLGFEPPP